MNLFERLKTEIVVSDGAMGTTLQKSGLVRGSPPDVWNLSHPEKVRDVHKAYVDAGAQIVTTNTFGATRIKLKEFGIDKNTESVNRKAVEIAISAAATRATVAGSIGPTGRFLKPFGDLTFDDAYETFREQASFLEGADVIMIETMIDSLELRAAVLGAGDALDVPIIAQFSFNEGIRTVTGTDARAACAILDALLIPVFGANCGSTLEDTGEVLRLMGEHTSTPLIVQANAGIGEKIVPPAEFADFAVKCVEYGANIVGSCCGSTPEYTRLIAKAAGAMKPVRRERMPSGGTVISSRTEAVYVGGGVPFLAVGERINPSGKRKLKKQMSERNIEAIKSIAVDQVDRGVQALDINTGGFDQHLMAEIFEALQTAVQVPLFVDSQDPETIEEALKVYGGKAVINSVNAREDMCSEILPIARRYGAAVIGLTMDEQGIPETPEARLDVARRVVRLAESYGIRACDVIIDSLVLPVGADESSAVTTMESVRRIKQELGVATILGISNVSYGLPVREYINQAFLMSTMQAGLDAAIIDPHEMRIMELVAASELLAGRDRQGQRYISKHVVVAGTIQEPSLHAVQKAVLSGNKDETVKQVNGLLESNELPLNIINEFLIPAMEQAGEKYERKEFFLPQLIGASEAMKQGIGVLIPLLGKGKSTGKKVLLATVEGDMHDLGKNLVKVILEANGYTVNDLGKDVKPVQIVETCKADSPDIVGLSCLMTTTLPSLQETVEFLREEKIGAKIVVGGASVEEKFAKQLGVLYAKDAIAAIKLLKSL